jgi:hypothetical protein
MSVAVAKPVSSALMAGSRFNYQPLFLLLERLRKLANLCYKSTPSDTSQEYRCRYKGNRFGRRLIEGCHDGATS